MCIRDRPTATLTADTTPIAIAVNPVTNMIYVANLGGGDVTVIDGATNAVVNAVSYTHLDVYKRQPSRLCRPCWTCRSCR